MGMSPVPTGTRISQEFGAFPGGYNPVGGHTGRDYATPVGTPALAIADGRVVWAADGTALPGGPNDWGVRWFFDKNYPGGLIVVEHTATWGKYLAAYAHMSEFRVRLGEGVRAGQIVGLTGNTGTATIGPHLHFEILPTSFAWGNGTYGRVHPGPFITEPYRPLGGTVVLPQTTKTRVLDGIDVSSYQPADIVRRVPAEFVIVKATEGDGWTSPHWVQQVKDALELGRKVGVYHYARPGNNSSGAEVRHFHQAVKAAGLEREPGLTWWLDWEEAAFYGYTAWASDFMAELDKLTGKTTGLYANTAGLTRGVWPAKDRARPLWRAIPVYSGPGYAESFHLAAPPAGWANLTLDQYSFHGRLPGYSEDLDLNVYYGGLLPWGAVGTTTVNLDTLEEVMATPEQRRALAKEVAAAVLTYRNEAVVGKGGPDVYALLVRAAGVLDVKIPVRGNDPEGKPYGGATSLRAEASWGTFRGFRDRRIEDAATEAAEGVKEVRELVDSLAVLVAEAVSALLPAPEDPAGESPAGGQNDDEAATEPRTEA